MILRRLLTTTILLTSTIWSQAQQINAVPDYVFRNQMSVGRNAVTDTAAYFSIGPRYGATKGFMPPIVVDTASFSGSKRNGLLIFSVQKNKFLYWDSVRVQWSDMAGSSGSYITGTLTNNYIPKATSSTTLGNTAMYDSSGYLRMITSNLGGGSIPNNPVTGMWLSKNGRNGFPLILQQNDSNSTGIQLALGLRKDLIVSEKPRPGFGVGHGMYLQDDASNWKLAGYISSNIVDSTSSGYHTEMRFSTQKANVLTLPLILRGDSTVRMSKLAGSGTRYVVADANGDLSATGSTALVDTTTISTRAWRQKGLDSLAALEVSGSGTINRVAKFTASGTIGNGGIADSASTVAMTILGTNNIGIGTVTPQYRLHTFGATGIRAETSSGNISTGIDFASAFVGGRVGGYYAYPGGGAIGNNVFGESANGAIQNIVFSESVFPLKLGTIEAGPLQFYSNSTERLRITSGGNVGIATTTPSALADINGVLRVFNASGAPTTGEGIEFQYASGQGEILTYNRTGSAYTSLRVRSSSMKFYGGGGAGGIDIFSTGRIGINTTTDAGYQLDVNGSIRGLQFYTGSLAEAGGFMRFNYATGNANSRSWRLANDVSAYGDFAIGQSTTQTGTTYDNTRLYISNGGNVGIGTASPSGKLTVVGANTNTYISIDNAGSGENYFAANAFQQWQTAGSPRMTLTSAGELLINTTSDAGDYKLQVSGNIYNTGSAVLAATSGNVGIGTASPGRRLHVQTPDGTASQLQIGQTNQRDYYIGIPASQTYFDFFDASAGASRMRINSDGEILVNPGSDAGDYKLQVSGNIYNTGSAVLAATSGQVQVGTTAWPTSLIGKSGSRSLIGNEGIFILWNEAAVASNNFAGLYLGAKGGGTNGSTTIAGGVIKGLSESVSSNAGALVFETNGGGGNVERGRINSAGEWIIDASGTDAGDYKLQVSGNIYNTGSITTGAPSGGSIKPWKIGEAATVSPTSPNRTIRVEIDGTVYYLHAKTTND